MLISFLFLDENILCGYSLEAPHRGASTEYPQHMFSLRNKKTIMWIPPLICSYVLHEKKSSVEIWMAKTYYSECSLCSGWSGSLLGALISHCLALYGYLCRKIRAIAWGRLISHYLCAVWVFVQAYQSLLSAVWLFVQDDQDFDCVGV